MNVSLTPDMERIVQKQVASGMYVSPDEVIREALLLLEERDQLRQLRLEELRKEIAIGIEEADKGKVAPLDMDAIRTKVAQRQAQGS